ncbi:MAG: helix-turn-helix transcriptional regulator [Desulfobacteraceae bacterium]|nr:helix-turn-helix transcriptional regulator [Desulfobacteraceae bacterium]
MGLRKKAGLTQEELAKRLHTQKSNISRLENVNSKISPKLSTMTPWPRLIGSDQYKTSIPCLEP